MDNVYENIYAKRSFLKHIPERGSVIDVGCGNNSPKEFRIFRPDLYYVGIDVESYNQSDDPMEFANEYLIVPPEKFTEAIEKYKGKMNAVVSSHNLEHCDNPYSVLQAMIETLKKGGIMYISFPCEESVVFPFRQGTLNFYDDKTHKNEPLSWVKVLKFIEDNNCDILYANKRYRPSPLSFIGFLLEPLFAHNKKTSVPTWSLYGFESIIWATAK